MTICSVRLDGFDGPLDLLLSLVREQRLDVTTVPLAQVAEQYLRYVGAMEALDVDAAAEYLVVAATLTFLKSRSLLPAIPAELEETGEESPEAVEARLRRTLIAYSRFREAASGLRRCADDAAGVYLREGGDAEAALVQRYRLETDALSRALLAALARAKPERRSILRERYSLLRQMEVVARAAGAPGGVAFDALVAPYDRAGVVCTFLAVLELVRQGRLRIEPLAGEAIALVAIEPPSEADASSEPLDALDRTAVAA